MGSSSSEASFLGCQAKLRIELHHFIDHEMDLSLLEGPSFNLERIKNEMHLVASYLDLSHYTHIDHNANLGLPQSHIEEISLCSTNPPLPKSLQQHLINETRSNLRAMYVRHLISSVTQNGSTLDELLMKRFLSSDKSEARKEKHQRSRAEFLSRARLQPPPVLRVIDIDATCQEMHVVLLDYSADGVHQVGYSALSHTYGVEVYEVFDCQCTSKCFAKVPRCSSIPCAHGNPDCPDSDKRDRVVNDIMHMCGILRAAGVRYAWHDGVCIAQHDESEVRETIMHIGWIYAYANETIIFLHYVGTPMAPIRHGERKDEVGCRWHTRVWTLQEAALSKCRRYCVRVGSSPLGVCQTLKEFEDKITLWYRDDSSKIDVIEEERFLKLLMEIYTVLTPLYHSLPSMDVHIDESSRIIWLKANVWYSCISRLLWTLMSTCLDFPTVGTAIQMCSDRDSKHIGDRINSILALAEVKDFVAPKDVNVEASTLEFFKRQGQRGLQWAVFASNYYLQHEDRQYFTEVRQHTWLPHLWRGVRSLCKDGMESSVEFRVLDDGKLEMTGALVCVAVRFTSRLEEEIWSHKKDHSLADAKDTQSLAPHDLAYFDMNLTAHDLLCTMRATLADAPACLTGTAIFPYFEVQSQGLVVADGREIGNDESFHGHLVFPQCIEGDESLGNEWPCIVVQGSLHDHVAKIGCFLATNVFFTSVLEKNLDRPEVTMIKKLVVR